MSQTWQYDPGITHFNGQVGIGVTTPNRALAVNGIIHSYNSQDNPGNGGLTLGDAGGHYWGFRRTATGSHLAIDAWNGSVNVEYMRIRSNNGYVGIGTSAPTAKLDVNGDIKATSFILPTGASAGKILTSDANGNATWQTATGSASGWALNGSTVGTIKSIGTVDNYDLPIITNNIERMRILAGGNVAIGTASLPASDAKLAVDGNIYTRKVKVTQTGWADYVFDRNYRLRPLSEVEQFIQQHHHLPEVPSAAEVKKNGLDLGDNQAILLKKIEELTLYVIEQKKQLEKQTQQLDQQAFLINSMQKLIGQTK